MVERRGSEWEHEADSGSLLLTTAEQRWLCNVPPDRHSDSASFLFTTSPLFGANLALDRFGKHKRQNVPLCRVFSHPLLPALVLPPSSLHPWVFGTISAPWLPVAPRLLPSAKCTLIYLYLYLYNYIYLYIYLYLYLYIHICIYVCVCVCTF